MSKDNLTSLESHFRFGDNWASYAKHINEERIAEAERGLLRLVPREELSGRTFLDIGCGSGIHSLAAARLGARRVQAVDLDPRSVETAQALLAARAPTTDSRVEVASVFDLTPDRIGTFDVVYSWGVLHHTGDLDTALRRAAALVAPGGLFAFALYRRTHLDSLWVMEKRWYTKASPQAQARARAVYTNLFKLGLLATGRDFATYAATYERERGMEFAHDVHDWLGGYPYEAIAPDEVETLMRKLGLSAVRTFARTGRSLGLLGSGCDEFVYRRA